MHPQRIIYRHSKPVITLLHMCISPMLLHTKMSDSDAGFHSFPGNTIIDQSCPKGLLYNPGNV